MTNSAKLYNQLSTVLYGHAWYGPPVYTTLDGLTLDASYQILPGSSHSIAEIIAHMLAWTEEVVNRMKGNAAGTPLVGDWPDVVQLDEQSLRQLIDNFKLANVQLLQLISLFPDDKWEQYTNDTRGEYSGDELSYETMIHGLIEHHVYHAGQIVVLNKLSNGW